MIIKQRFTYHFGWMRWIYCKDCKVKVIINKDENQPWPAKCQCFIKYWNYDGTVKDTWNTSTNPLSDFKKIRELGRGKSIKFTDKEYLEMFGRKFLGTEKYPSRNVSIDDYVEIVYERARAKYE